MIRRLPLLIALSLSPCVSSSPLTAQSELAGSCSASASSEPFCRMIGQAAEIALPRMALVAGGGSPVQGTASTLGMRLNSNPRWTLGLRLAGSRFELPRVDASGATGTISGTAIGLAANVGVGVLQGFSPLPTVGGVASLDLLGSIGLMPFLGGDGYLDQSAWTWGLGARLGLLRESFTLPGASVSLMYRRLEDVALGDADLEGTDSHVSGTAGVWSARAAISRTVVLLRLTAGVGYDRLSGELDLGFRDGTGTHTVRADDWHTERITVFGSASYSLLVLHFTVEAGWQEAAPDVGGVPAGAAYDPDGGLFAGIGVRLSI